MQTFLPYSDFRKSAKVLDNRRLAKQRVESFQILNILLSDDLKKGWRNHPAVLMWKGYEKALLQYAVTICDEWISRGGKDTVLQKLLDIPGAWTIFHETVEVVLPPFVGNDAFHAAHRSNLLRKNLEFYSQYGWEESNDLPYVWPTKEKMN